MKSSFLNAGVESEQEFNVTFHAQQRMNRRHVSPDEIESVLTFGRSYHVRGAIVYAIGHKEVRRYRNQIDLSQCDGLQIVCSIDNNILTVYRNQDFSSLKRKNKFSRSHNGDNRHIDCDFGYAAAA